MLDRFDLAFANLYVLDKQGHQAALAGAAGDLQRGSVMCPEIVTLVEQTSSPSYVAHDTLPMQSLNCN
jgi:hypothetical protein